MPNVLLPEQEDELKARIINIDELLSDEAASLVKEKEETAAIVRTNRARIEELSAKLSELRKQVQPTEKRRDRDRGDRDRGRHDSRQGDDVDELGRSRRRELEEDQEMGGEEGDEKEREAGRIDAEEGDVEVEY